MVELLAAAAAALLGSLAEALHAKRSRRIAGLAFGPARRPAAWVRVVPLLRPLAAAACAWGFTTLLLLPPRVHEIGALPEERRQHLVLVLDVSPSMRLVDAGPTQQQSRMHRARDVMESFFRRVPLQQYRISVVATYNGAKPVVEDTSDLDVVRNILGDLPMHHAFPSGRTDIFSGLEEAARMAEPWPPDSAIVVLVSDGDTVPAIGMPQLPASVRRLLVVGVGDPLVGRFLDGRQSRQDRSTLRQIAVRLDGVYHDGNARHLPTDVLDYLTTTPGESPFRRLTRRDYALIAVAVGTALLALLPLLLHLLGSRWRPGARPAAPAAEPGTTRLHSPEPAAITPT
jgi:Ca-activated chloride channel family protein